MTCPPLWVSSSVGSRELLPTLVKLGVPARLTQLDSADFAFEGHGPEGPAQVGLERKTVTDLIDSLNTGRLQGPPSEASRGGQLSRLRDAYDFVFLVVEGSWAVDRQGRLTRRRRPMPGQMTEDALIKRVLSIYWQSGIRLCLWRTITRRETAAFVASCYHWFTDKPWDAHTTMLTVYDRGPLTPRPLSLFREMVMRLPGIGLAASTAAEQAFQGSMDRALHGSVADWAAVQMGTSDGGSRRLGETRATAIVEATTRLMKGTAP